MNSICVLCKAKTAEKLICPAKSKLPANSYSTVSRNILKFHEINQLPLQLNIAEINDGNGIESYFKDHSVCWHKSCANLFSNLKLERKLNQLKKVEKPSTSRTVRTSFVTTADVPEKCLFCDKVSTKFEKLHQIETLRTSSKIREIANRIEDQHILLKINTSSDLIASEVKYHLPCLSAFYRRYPKSSEVEHRKNNLSTTESIALTMVIDYIVDQTETNKASVFYLKDITTMYTSNLKLIENGSTCDFDLNCSRIKERLLKLMPSLQEGKQGKHIVFFFPKNVPEALRLYDDFNNDEEALCLSKAASILRKRLKEKKYTFSGSFANNTEQKDLEIVPKDLTFFFSLLLRGASQTTNDTFNKHDAVDTLSQLVIFNVTNKPSSSDSATKHYNESPLPIYIATKLYSQTRQKELIDTFYQLGLCISYKRLLSITTSMTNNVIKFYEQEQCVISPNLLKNVFTTLAVDNVDYNPSATTTQSSFHGTAISVQQHPSSNASGEKIDFNSNIDPSSSTAISSLPDFYAIVPVYELKNKNISLETKSPVPLPPVDEDIAFKDWLDNCRNTILTNNANDMIFSWAAFQASTVKEVLPRSKICLLPLFYEVSHSAAMIRHAMLIAKQGELL